MDIGVIGKVSTGKSSFINTFYAVIGNMDKKWAPIATVSLQRETFNVTRYILSDNVKVPSKEQYTSHAQRNEKMRKGEKLPSLGVQEITVASSCKYIHSIMDFPGVDDNNDKRDCMSFYMKTTQHLSMFVVSAERALVETSEIEYLKRLVEWSNKLNTTGTYHQLIVIVTKYDYDDDNDLNEIYDTMMQYIGKLNNTMTVPIRVFRWSAYSVLRAMHQKGVICPFYNKEIRKSMAATVKIDIDGLVPLMQKIDLIKCGENVRHQYILEQLRQKSIPSKHILELIQLHYQKDTKICGALCENWFSTIQHHKHRIYDIQYNLPSYAFNELIFQRWHEEVTHYVYTRSVYQSIFTVVDVKDLTKYMNAYRSFSWQEMAFFKHPIFGRLAAFFQLPLWEIIESHRNYLGGIKCDYIHAYPMDDLKYFGINHKKILDHAYRTIPITPSFIFN